MANLEEEMHNLKENNTELAQKMQYWKMTAEQRENEKLALMKENNELRLKLSKLKSLGSDQARNLDVAIQEAGKRALANLVQASEDIAHTMQLAKTYIRDRQELEAISPRWSALSNSPTAEKADRVHRVPPLLVGGQSIQPVVALSRTLLNPADLRIARTPNQNRNVTMRPLPMHILQDVYIPLTRIDAGDRQNVNTSADSDEDNHQDVDEDLDLQADDVIADMPQNMNETEGYDEPILEAIREEEPEDAVSAPRFRPESPLEGPSWLLDVPAKRVKHRSNLEPDSTTGVDEDAYLPSPVLPSGSKNSSRFRSDVTMESCVFTPTMRRRKRMCPPVSPSAHHLSPSAHHLSPSTHDISRTHLFSPAIRAASPCPPRASPHSPGSRRNSTNGRVLKVLVAKMQLDDSEGDEAEVSPPTESTRALGNAFPSPVAAFPGPENVFPSPENVFPSPGNVLSSPGLAGGERYVRFDAPSPNGATDARVIVSEAKKSPIIDVVKKVSSEGSRGGRQKGKRKSRERANKSCKGPSDCRGESGDGLRGASDGGSDSRDSDDAVEGGRSRRNRKPVTYKENPLNRKMRR